MSLYLRKAEEQEGLPCHCDCSQGEAIVVPPCQLDCPWCGCGWLFSCLTCRKAVAVAEVSDVGLSYQDICLKLYEGLGLGLPSTEDVMGFMRESHRDLFRAEPGDVRVYLDGAILDPRRRYRFVGMSGSIWTGRTAPHMQACGGLNLLGRRETWKGC